jgi:2-keto-4-pentenoate hydratase/2-oxohepta-3-ene-1,7-dioic acid hydratase in catechol pathway
VKLVRLKDGAGHPIWARLIDADNAVPLAGDPLDECIPCGDPQRISVRLAPVEPPNIIAIGRNYRDHALEMGAETRDEEPLIFLKATSSIIGPDEAIVLPTSAPNEVDFEAELGVVIGRRAKNVSEAESLQYVLGYTCANDVSARDCQRRRDRQWARGKSFDTFCPVGPVLVTPDEVDTHDLSIRSRLNGVIMQDARTSEMIVSVAALVSYLSRQFTLLPGTLILTGTPAGVGAARTPPVYLRPEDEIIVEIEGIGSLCNRVRGPSR